MPLGAGFIDTSYSQYFSKWLSCFILEGVDVTSNGVFELSSEARMMHVSFAEITFEFEGDKN